MNPPHTTQHQAARSMGNTDNEVRSGQTPTATPSASWRGTARRAPPHACWAYFVTICTRDRECLFGHVVNGEMRLNDAGRMVRSVWEGLPDRFSGMELDAFVVMPNHVHGIIAIHGRGKASAVPFHVSKERPESDASPLQPCSP